MDLVSENRGGAPPEALAATANIAELGRTIVDPPRASGEDQAVTVAATRPADALSGRTTVLPRVEAARSGDGAISDSVRARYEHLRLLGAGGMGEVTLAQDHDIGRRVALKRLLPQAASADGLARFVDEIRTIGSLEHPNIVPIHDVGVDAEGRYFFIMKYVDGETLESIIARLAAGEPKAHARYTFEYRIQIFMGLLRALEYAHSHGIVHRDLKPANVMIGGYDEVILMDWGVARSVRAREPAVASPSGGDEQAAAGRERLYTTRHGSLVGTPAYMSPEQASGRNDLIDERSDVYSATVLFHELLYLEHYLANRTTLATMLDGVLNEEPSFIQLGMTRRHPHQARVPAELVHFVAHGLRKDPARRWQSSREMIFALEEIIEGRVRIQCHATLTKRIVREIGRFVDRHPQISFGCLLALAAGAGVAGYRAIHSLFG
jgi:serine/threonine-protein kinase